MFTSVIRRTWFAVLSVGFVLAIGGQALADSKVGALVPGSKAASIQPSQCVEPTPYMRRHHMELILHQRDKTVHEGIRSKKYSLAACIDCHVARGDGGREVPVNAEGQFCDSCHDYVGVSLTCFQCHATVPTPASAHK